MLRWINENLNKSPLETTPTPSTPPPPPTSPYLPGNLAARILDLEYQCESDQVTK